MLIILTAIILGILAVHAMTHGDVAATVFFCFCLHWIRDCFVVVGEGEKDGN